MITALNFFLLLTATFYANSNTTTYEYDQGYSNDSCSLRLIEVSSKQASHLARLRLNHSYGYASAPNRTTCFAYSALLQPQKPSLHPAGRRTKTIDPLGNETTSVYDALGRRTQSTDALGRITTFEYNALGNLTQTNFANGTNTTTTYDNLSRKIAETDLAGLQTQYEYSDAGNLTAVIDSLGQRTEYTYDQRGNKTAQIDALGRTTSWTYDALNRVTSRTLPEGEVETYAYDSVGNRTSKTDFNGDVTSYEYNNLNQLIKTTYSDTTTVVNTYTITGQIETVTESNGTTSYQYDAQDRLTRIDYPTGNHIAYQYDLNGNRTQVQTANQTVDYTFDALNRLATVIDSSGTTTYTYDDVGNRASQINANGTTATYQHDDLNRLIDLTHTNSTNNVIASYAYTLGANGNRVSIAEATGRVVDYTYDELYRLINETVSDSINGDHYSEFAYDAVGNRLQQFKDGITTTYSYNNNDWLLTETEDGITTSYLYDNNGNTLSKTIDGTLDTSYSYNSDNRMVQAVTTTSTIDYAYDASGIRQSQTVDGVITNYLIDPNRSYAQVLEESDDQGNVIVSYGYGDDLLTQTRNGETFTYGYDGLGSTRILTDATGSVQNAYGYEAFGELDYQHGSVENAYLFTGEQYDNNVGFYYLRARYYNPEIGRFSQMDVYQGLDVDPISLHKYLYTENNPINMIDPSGYVATTSELSVGLNVQAILNTFALGSLSYLSLNPHQVVGHSALDNDLRAYGAYNMVVSKANTKAEELAPDVEAALTNGSDDNNWHGHHTVPIYMCGAVNQSPNMVPLKSKFHIALHSSLRLYSEFIDELYDVAFDNTKSIFDHTSSANRGGLKELARTKLGRSFIGKHLSAFYSTGWYRGNVNFKPRFEAEKQLFVNTLMRNSLPNCQR